MPTLLLTGCAAGNRPAPAQSANLAGYPGPSATPSAAPAGPGATARGTFLPWTPGATAVTYDTAVVPPGAVAAVTVARRESGVTVRLAVTGMVPRRSYGAHLHTGPCTAMPEQAGPHYQHRPDPKASPSHPSTDPRFANPRNELWLDFTADARGAAVVGVTQPWTFDEVHPPRSLILHAESTRTGKGVAGTAGPRVACLTLAAR
jgi:superoxide dismutase, Cu-Zn family